MPKAGTPVCASAESGVAPLVWPISGAAAVTVSAAAASRRRARRARSRRSAWGARRGRAAHDLSAGLAERGRECGPDTARADYAHAERAPEESCDLGSFPHRSTPSSVAADDSEDTHGGRKQSLRTGHRPVLAHVRQPQVLGLGPMESRSAAERRAELVELYKEAAVCARCPLSKTRTRVVFGSGNADADLMFVGEAPRDARGPAGAAVRRPSRAAPQRAAGGDRARARRRLHRERAPVAAAREPRPPARRDRRVQAVPPPGRSS